MFTQLRNIIHDWPDAEAAIILRNVRNAMAPHSRLLIRTSLISLLFLICLGRDVSNLLHCK